MGTYLFKTSCVGWSITSRCKHSHFTAAVTSTTTTTVAIAPVIITTGKPATVAVVASEITLTNNGVIFHIIIIHCSALSLLP